MLKILCINTITESAEFVEIENLNELIKDRNNVFWFDFIINPGKYPDDSEKQILKNVLNIHDLIIEDCVVPKHLPKIEDFQDYTFLIISKFSSDIVKNIETHKICFMIAKNYLITYRHQNIKEIDSLINNVETLPKNIHKIFYNILDRIVDSYIPLIDLFDIEVDKIEAVLFRKPENTKILQVINKLRSNLSIIRRSLVMEKDIFYTITKGYFNHIADAQSVYFKDIYDHLTKALDNLENQREDIANTISIQLNLNTQKLNDLIKFLTVISSSILPASLIAGIFGMNFANMPLIGMGSGFAIALLLMLCSGFIVVMYFKFRKWI